ncbi:RraA family protein [Roseivivax isoporae]|uniref:Putative 4-hydroxy-4-methyl-2-oxoglutarate aldolase n=1 Tax=Roseivivax isoporae LMG 25204 TaxID=1449351 RepID=X7F7V2_9RHOB|nr:RraA family protein [Roseivivax isoporae]ETX28987.1 hypothetical protein RISW2_03335 [Roseivivax isoporae LMG 25204]
MSDAPSLEAEVLDRYRRIGTSTISDALDRLGLKGAVEGLSPLQPHSDIAGQAFTVSYLPAGPGGGTVGDFLDRLGPGSVVVIDNRGRTDCTVWGNIMTEVAKAQGVEGTVIDGVNRDLRESREVDYAIWSRRGHMRTGKDRVVLNATGVPVCLDRVRVDPGDVIRADANGVVVVPLARAMDVLAAAEEIEAKEDAILTAVRDGMPLGEARRKHGYHALQTRST